MNSTAAAATPSTPSPAAIAPPEIQPTDVTELMRRLGRIMGAVDVLAKALPQDCSRDEPDYQHAAEAIYDQLEDLSKQIFEIHDSIEHGGAIAIDAPAQGRIVCRLVRDEALSSLDG